MAPRQAPPRPHDAPGLLPLPLPGSCPTSGGMTEAQDARSPVAQLARGGRRLSGKRDNIYQIQPSSIGRAGVLKEGLIFSACLRVAILRLKNF